MKKHLIGWLIILLLPALLLADGGVRNHRASVYRLLPGSPGVTLWNVNNISGWIGNDGYSGNNPFTGESGVVYPRQTAGVIFQDGFIWGGYIHDDHPRPLRVGGQTYISGTAPGRIIATGVPQNPDDPDVRIYRIRRDWQTVPDSVLRLDAAELNNVDPASVTQAMIDAVRAQYRTDWEQWPVQYGAPWYDRNGNGVYDPGTDEPGLADADQVIWFVCNDLDSSRTSALYGSLPIGLELQVTIWAYHQPGNALGQTAFRRYRLINKSGSPVDSMFIAQWSDPDLGYYADDFLGCDSTLDLVYCYNGYPTDTDYQKFGLPPAAVGYLLWQGPRVPSPGDTAYFNFRPVPDYKNLPMTSFAYFASGSYIADPDFGDYQGTVQWYNMLNGYLPTADTLKPTPYTHGSGRHSGQPTRFPLNGDPLAGTGDVDGTGNNMPPGARRMALCSGPFTLQPGDTQEVVIAVIGGIDPAGNHLSALEKVRAEAAQIRSLRGRPMLIPRAVSRVASTPDSTTLTVQVDFGDVSGISDCTLELVPRMGDDPAVTLALYDDGQHGDSLGGDGIWGNSISVRNRKYLYTGNLQITQEGHARRFPAILENVRLRPSPRLTNFRIVWENALQNRQVDPGEKVHIAVTVQNPDRVNEITELSLMDSLRPVPWQNALPAGGSTSGDSLILIRVAPDQGDSLRFSVGIFFDHQWERRRVSLPLTSWALPPVWGDTLKVTAIRGQAENVIPIVADPTALTGHDYLITFNRNPVDPSVLWNLTDRATGESRLAGQPTGSSADQDFPVADGVEWNVIQPAPGLLTIVEVANRLGPLPPEEWDSTGAPYHGNYVWHDVSAASDLNPFYLSTGMDGGSIEFILRSIENSDYHDFEIRFTEGGGIFQWWFEDDSWAAVPFEAWDVGIGTYDDPTDDIRCLTGGFSGGGTTGIFDLVNSDPFQGYPASDWVYLRVPIDSQGTYQKFYQDVTSGTGFGNWWAHSQEVLARLTFCDYTRTNSLPETGTVIRFVTTKPNYPGDSLLASASQTGIRPFRYTFELAPNYPNPFNRATVIRYTIVRPVKVTLEIFNVLGQRVKTLTDKHQAPGMYRAEWDGRNSAGAPVGSGMYFFRLKAGDFVKVRKMILLR